MAIEIKYAINMALQYNNANEFNIEDYLLADNETGKKFLTESPALRVLNDNEKSCLYFLIDDSLFTASVYYEMYNKEGVKIDQEIGPLGYNHLIHNSIPVNTNVVYFEPETHRLDVSMISTGLDYLTEIKSYIIDKECYSHLFQIHWLNKLGGRDTFMFTAKPNIETTVERNNLIELSKLSNFESPKRIYGYREHISRKIYRLVHQCKDRETADWLKRELIDSIDVMIVINDYYYPVLVVNISVQEDKISHDYIVEFQFRLAFNNNIQTR